MLCCQHNHSLLIARYVVIKKKEAKQKREWSTRQDMVLLAQTPCGSNPTATWKTHLLFRFLFCLMLSENSSVPATMQKQCLKREESQNQKIPIQMSCQMNGMGGWGLGAGSEWINLHDTSATTTGEHWTYKRQQQQLQQQLEPGPGGNGRTRCVYATLGIQINKRV